MNNILKNIAIFTLVTVFGTTAFGQLTITLPNFPKIKKTRPDTTTITTTNDTNRPDNTEREQTNTQTSSDSCSGDIVMDVYLKDIEKTRKEAAEYTPGGRDYYVSDYSDRENKYLKASLSPSRRQEWMKNWPAKSLG